MKIDENRDQIDLCTAFLELTRIISDKLDKVNFQ